MKIEIDLRKYLISGGFYCLRAYDLIVCPIPIGIHMCGQKKLKVKKNIRLRAQHTDDLLDLYCIKEYYNL